MGPAWFKRKPIVTECFLAVDGTAVGGGKKQPAARTATRAV